MAALTSTQSGNWNASATWGGSAPADGDTFTIAQGHKVTVSSDFRAGTGKGIRLPLVLILELVLGLVIY